VPVRRRSLARVTRKLDWNQTLNLIIGAGRGEPVFDSDQERRLAWQLHREELMNYGNMPLPGQRPAGWWDFDSPEPLEDELDMNTAEWPYAEARQLHRLGKLEHWEIEELTARYGVLNLDGPPTWISDDAPVYVRAKRPLWETPPA
jgi:hypothetical protein